MPSLRSIARVARRALGIPRRISEEEFRRQRRESLDPVVRSGACYVPMQGYERTRHYRDKQNLHHLGRYEWAERVLASRPGPHERVLDCACGVGYGSATLAARFARVDAVDVYEAALHIARARYDRPNITWHCMDAADLRRHFEAGSFDAIVSMQTIECVENDAAFLDDLHALLRPEGALLIDTPLRKYRVDKPENPHHRRNYALEEWIDMLTSRFKEVHAFGDLPESGFLERCLMPSGGSIAVCVKS